MREILFRAKREDNKEWVDGYYVRTYHVDYGYSHYIFSGFHGYTGYGHGDEVEILPDTIGQFTGLTDKNGTKIFEGDIVASVNYDGTISKDTVFYHGGNEGYGCYLPFGNDMDSCMGSDVKVIGNIHEKGETK